MNHDDEDDLIDKNILNLFRLLHLLDVVKGDYEVYGLQWGSRQQYIYRRLTRTN